MLRPDLTPEQQAQAEHLAEIITQAGRQEILALARLLVSKSDREVLGATEFQVRDLVHRFGAKAIETALMERKKGATKGPV
jgi:hypothetical protein